MKTNLIEIFAMNRCLQTVCRAIAILACCTAAGRLWAQTADTATAVGKLMDTAWKPSQENFEAAKKQYEQLKLSAAGDVRIPFAMSLVAMRNHRAAEAAQYLEEALVGNKPLLPIRQARIWVAVLRDDDAAAHSGISKLAQSLAANPSRADYQQMATWLGSALGYFAGPGKNQLKPSELAAIEAELAETLKGPLAAALAEGKEAATKQFAELQQQLADAQKTAKERSETKLAEDRKKNEADLADVSQKRQLAEKNYQEFQEKSNIQEKERNLRSAENDIRQLKNLQTELNRNLNDEKRKKPEQQNRLQINNWSNQLQNAQGQERKLDGEARRVRGELNALSGQNAALLRDGNKLVNAEKALRAKLDRATSASGEDGTTANLSNKLKSISTYAGVDLDQARQQIIDSYGKK